MEIKQNSENEKSENTKEPDLDELVKSIPTFEKNSDTDLEQEQVQQRQSGYKTSSMLFHFLSVFGIVFLSIFFIFGIYLTPIKVVGESMLPNINKQVTSATDTSHCDVVYYKKKKTYTYGDVIIISNKQSQYIDNSKNEKPIYYLIKRVVACPGDTISFVFDVQVDYLYYYYIVVKDKNGNQVEFYDEDYIKEPMLLNHRTLQRNNYSGLMKNIAEEICEGDGIYQVTINENCYFAMGDNRNNSTDCRSFGEISEEDICGNVRLQVEYGENIWVALIKKIKSYLSITFISVKENL